ncbi:hypothetical protein [Pontibacillus yanchengensis]|nr:hypothetical protein [Pontibacillus yanchengensis]
MDRFEYRGIWINKSNKTFVRLFASNIYYYKALKGSDKMKRVMDALNERKVMERMPVLKMEIDYELMNLHEAMEQDDQEKMNITKDKLEALRLEWITLQQ